MRKLILAASMAALALPAAPALADRDGYDRGHHRGHHKQRYYRTDNGIQYWRGDDGRYRCRRGNGTTGMLIGGVAGALVGRAIDTRGDRAVGTIVGAGAGALLGREIERGGERCR
jgi:hypothetical protein